MKNFTPEGVQDVVTVDADGALVLPNLLDTVVVFAGGLEALDLIAVLALVAEGAEDQGGWVVGSTVDRHGPQAGPAQLPGQPVGHPQVSPVARAARAAAELRSGGVRHHVTAVLV